MALRIALELRNFGATNQSIAALSLPANVENQGMGHRKACYHHKIGQGITMPKVRLSGMTVQALMDLQTRVDEALNERRAEIEKQLKMFAVVGSRRVVRGGVSALKGKKVRPKYRSRSGETWAGRGAKPKWLVAAIKRGRKLEDFLIGKGRRKRRSKR